MDYTGIALVFVNLETRTEMVGSNESGYCLDFSLTSDVDRFLTQEGKIAVMKYDIIMI